MSGISPLPRDKVKKILMSNGFKLIKSHGKHMKFKKFNQDGKCVATTFVSHRPDLQPYHIRDIIKQSHKPEEEFY